MDIDHGSLAKAFQRARRECRFFPKIAELRELAGSKPDDIDKVEAEAAWQLALDYLHQWGLDLSPLYRNGEFHYAPPLPQRVVYALRRVGGLRGLNNLSHDARPFAFKDFAEAYKLAPLAEQVSLRLCLALPKQKSRVKKLTDGRKYERAGSQSPTVKPKPIPVPMTDAQLRDRRELLSQQVALLMSKERKRAVSGLIGNDSGSDISLLAKNPVSAGWSDATNSRT